MCKRQSGTCTLEITSYLSHATCSDTRTVSFVLLLSLFHIFKERTDHRSDINHPVTLPGDDSCMSFDLKGVSVAAAVLVEPSGIEPLTSCVQGRRSPS